MTVIAYKHLAYVPTVALLIDFEADNKFLAGSTITAMHGDLRNYLYQCSMSLQSKLGGLDTEHYHIYTIDMQGFDNLYVQVGNYVRNVFGKWQDLLTEYLKQDLSSTLASKICSQYVVSTAANDIVQIHTVADIEQKSTFERLNMFSARFINIAIPKALANTITFWHKIDEPGILDTVQAKQALLHEQTTYDLTDFEYVRQPIGQKFTIDNASNLRLSIRMTSCNAYHKVLCNSYTVKALDKLSNYCQYSIIGDKVTVSFRYNANRNYELTANAKVVKEDMVPVGTVLVRSADMLEHASVLGILRNKYIDIESSNNTVTLPAAYSNVQCKAIKVRSWRLDYYTYFDRFATNTLQWTAATDKYIPVQVNDKKFNINLFLQSSVTFNYGCLHTFMLETNYNSLDKQFQTKSTLDKPDIAFADIELPRIYNGIVTFRNLTYKFIADNAVTTDLDGKQFALVLKHDTTTGIDDFYHSIELITNATYAIIVLHVDLTKVINHAGVSSVNELQIMDFYNANAVDLLARTLSAYIEQLPGYYTVQVDASCRQLTLEPPLV